MENIPVEQITKRFQSLNTTLQDAIFSPAATDTVLKICALRDVPDNKTPLVGQLVNRVLLGYLRPENFAAEIQKETGIDGMKAAQVAHDIDTEIFSTVRLELKKLYPPTIQTPTVQAQGFVPRAPEPPAVAVRRAPEVARPYVVPIPEKFRAKPIWPAHPQAPESIPAAAETPTPMPAIEKKEVVPPTPAIPEPKPVTAPVQPVSQSIPVKEELKPETPSAPIPDIKPIVPLPTFIQSKFKETLKQTTGEKQATQENPALKNAITQFTTPHTAAKPAEEKPRESIYREQISESEQQQGSAPTSTPQKAQGKVIDLSGL